MFASHPQLFQNVTNGNWPTCATHPAGRVLKFRPFPDHRTQCNNTRARYSMLFADYDDEFRTASARVLCRN